MIVIVIIEDVNMTAREGMDQIDENNIFFSRDKINHDHIHYEKKLPPKSKSTPIRRLHP
jgi:hypothetical protein